MLIGTKADLYVQRAVSREDGQQLADKYQIPFYEVSSRNGVGLSPFPSLFHLKIRFPMITKGLSQHVHFSIRVR